MPDTDGKMSRTPTAATTPFVLLSSQRSGSSWSVEMLNSHPAIRAHGELFNVEGEGIPRRGAQSLPFFETWRASTGGSPAGFLDLVFAAEPGIAAAGFKLMVGQAGAYPGLVEALEGRHARVVHLVRRNVLDVVLSKEAAVLRERFSAAADDHVEAVRIRLPARSLVSRLEEQEREHRRGRRLFAASSDSFLEITYESLREDPARFGDVLRFLSVPEPGRPLHADMRKMNVQRRSALIENFAQIRDVLGGTRFEWMLGSGEPE